MRKDTFVKNVSKQSKQKSPNKLQSLKTLSSLNYSSRPEKMKV